MAVGNQMRLLASLDQGAVLASGIYPDMSGADAPLWLDGYNVDFRGGYARKSRGLLGLEDLAARPTGMKATIAATEPRLFVGAGTHAYRYRASDGLTSIANLAASGGVYQFVPLDTWGLISNGVNPVQLWQNAGTAAAITAPFTRANCIFGYQLQAFAGGTSNSGQNVEWSPINVFDDWTPTLINTAGNLRLRDMSGDIVTARKLGNSIGIYSGANAGIFTYLGAGGLPYGFFNPIAQARAISAYSVVTIGSRHFGVTYENVFTTDLVSADLIDDPAIRDYIQAITDWDRAQEVYGWPDWANNSIRWSMPQVGGATYGISFRFDKGTWTRHADNVVVGEESGAFKRQFFGKTNRLLNQDPTGFNNDGVAMPSYLETKLMDLGDSNRYKTIHKISLDYESSGDVSISFGYSNDANTSPTWVYTADLASEFWPQQFGMPNDVIYMALKITSTGSGAYWRLRGGEIRGDYTGYVS